MSHKKFLGAAVSAAILALGLVFHCELPQDPTDPSNTSVRPVLRNSDLIYSNQSITDTVGNVVYVGAAINLPENIDSIRITVWDEGKIVFDTMARSFKPGRSDTVWKKLYFTTSGYKTATITPHSTLEFLTVSGTINIIARTGPPNNKPSISVKETALIRSAEPCSLLIETSDADALQALSVGMIDGPTNATIEGNSLFLWTPPADYAGYDTITFMVTDNGKPPLSDTATVIITVTATPHPPVIEVSGNRSVKPLETCTLRLKATDDDTGQQLTIALSGDPAGSAIVSESLFVWTPPAGAEGTYDVRFTVTDNGVPPLSASTTVTITVAQGVVNHAPKWVLDSLPLSLNDTASYKISLGTQCTDIDGDSLTYSLLAGLPAGDTVVGSHYSFKATPAAIGKYVAALVVADPANAKDTLYIKIAVESSVTDNTQPLITLIAPAKDSGISTAATYTLDVICTDASGIASVSAAIGSTTIPATPTDGHYLMAVSGLTPGVYTAIVLTATDASGNANTRTRTVYVKYSPGFSVTYNGNGNTTGTVPIDAGVYEAGASVTVKGNTGSLVKAGATFAGWNTAADGSGAAYAAGAAMVMGSANDTLYARWTTNPTYTVVYNGNGSTGGAVPIDAGAYEAGATVTVKANTGSLVKTGATFAGWNTAADGSGTAYAAGAMFAMGAVNDTLYARWTTNPTYAVAYHGNGNTGGTVPADAGAYEVGATVTVKANTGSLVKTGSTFAGWNTAADGSGTAYAAGATFAMGAANDTLYARWTTNPTYTVVYNGNGSTGGAVPVDAGAYEAGATVTVKANTGSLVKTGSTFAGWNTAVDGSGTAYAAGATFAMGAANDTLYARWTTNPTYTVVYNGSGSTGGAVPVDAGAYEAGATVTVKANTGSLVKTGSTFAGWNTAADGSGTAYAAGATFAMGAANDTLYARWTAKQYTVTYSGNGNSGGTVPNDAVPHDSATSVTVAPNTGSLTRIGYTFTGWNTAANGSGTSYTAGTGSFIIHANATLYATWTIKTYTLTYNGNGNAGGSVPASGSPIDSNTAITIPGNTGGLTRLGYDFSGWNTAANGSGTAYAAGATLRIRSDTTLFARWTVKRYTVTVTSSSATRGTVNPSGNVTVDSGATTNISATPLSGYVFKQWTVTSGQATIANPTSASTTVRLTQGNATVQAVFGCVTFAKKFTFSQYSYCFFNDGVQTEDGGYLIIAQTSDIPILIKLNQNGDTVWTKTTYLKNANSISKVGNGYIVSGDDNAGGSAYSDISCYAQNGNVLWSYSHDSRTDPNGAAITLQTNDGGYIIGGQSNARFLLVKLTSTRSVVWDSVFNVGGGMLDCRPTRDGGYMLVGTCCMGLGSQAIKTNSVGKEEWADGYKTTYLASYSTAGFFSVDTTSDGGCVIGGEGNINGELRGFVFKIALNGNVGRFTEYNDASRLRSVKVLNNGDCMMAGATRSKGTGGGDDIYIIRVNSSGTVLHETTFGESNDEYGLKLKLTSDGGAVVVGSNVNGPTSWVIKTDENCAVEP